MHSPTFRLRAGAAIVVALALLTPSAFAQDAGVGVTVDGQPVALSPAPITRAGRVFVPLRGVFERLGASVVYQNGQINAQGRNHAVSLQIGSTQATVDGQTQTLDVAPFIVGASTYVPLRFVSQALGETVNYDGTNRIVAITTGGGPAPRAYAPPPPQQQPQPPQASQLQLRDEQPGRDATVDARRPTIAAQFAGVAADPNSIRVTLDGLDVTDQATRSADGIVFSPPSDLQSQRHEVVVRGRDVNGLPFERRWSFVSGQSHVSNFVRDLQPTDETLVGRQFTVSGRTLPGARVVVQVGTVDQPGPQQLIGQILGTGGANTSVRSEVTADPDGSFSLPIDIDVPSGARLTMVVDSTDASTKTAAPRQIRNLRVQG